MFGILLLWLAFSPLQPLVPKPAAPSEVQLHSKGVQPLTPNSAGSNPVAEKIHTHFKQLLMRKSPEGGRERELFNIRFAQFYEARGYQPVWTKRTMIAELISAVEAAGDDGLDPADYHLKEIREAFQNPPATPELQACYDLLLTDTFLTLASHLHYGKVDPVSLDTNWNLSNAASRIALELRLQNALASEQVAAILKELRPQHSKYEQLRKGLVRYRAIARSGGWHGVADGSPLKEGMKENRVLQLRRRLEASGYLAGGKAQTPLLYNREVAEGVKRFQESCGMKPDGVAGASTLKMLNIPVERRIEQIRINLERYRWFLGDLEPTYVMVNIASFTLHYVENNSFKWGTRVIVGKPARETPIFKADMQYIVFNPQWVIPPTILGKDALPAIRKNRSYLASKKLSVIDHNGHVVDPGSVNWSQYSAANFPYRLQQSSGDHGALGRIKFMLPNPHVVYLHDTPTKDLFEKNSRTFSSGCIRVEHPLELAELVLQDSVKWNGKRIRETIDRGKTSTVQLPKRLPVFILYMTTLAKGDNLIFLEDVYNRDESVLKALNKPAPQYKMESCGL